MWSRAFKAGKIASLIGMEGGHSINNSMATLRQMYALGARYMTLTHTHNTDWADSATDKPEHHGLTPFGEAVVHEMNRLGMLVDLSHVSPETMAAALRVSKAPVIFSHSSARAICDHPRNVPDDILRQVTANGGVVMVNFYPNFLVPEGGKQATELYALQRTLEDAHPGDMKAVEAGMNEYRKSHPLPKATIKLVADHVDHVKQVAGVDHVGIGSDFDGIDITPEGLEDVSKYPALTAELLSRGWSDEDVKKFLGLNVLRAMRQAEAVAASMKNEPPSVAMLPTAADVYEEVGRSVRRSEQDGVDEQQLARFRERAIVRVLGKRDHAPLAHGLLDEVRLLGQLRPRVVPHEPGRDEAILLRVDADVRALIEADRREDTTAFDHHLHFPVGARREVVLGVELDAQH